MFEILKEAKPTYDLEDLGISEEVYKELENVSIEALKEKITIDQEELKDTLFKAKELNVAIEYDRILQKNPDLESVIFSLETRDRLLKQDSKISEDSVGRNLDKYMELSLMDKESRFKDFVNKAEEIFKRIRNYVKKLITKAIIYFAKNKDRKELIKNALENGVVEFTLDGYELFELYAKYAGLSTYTFVNSPGEHTSHQDMLYFLLGNAVKLSNVYMLKANSRLADYLREQGYDVKNNYFFVRVNENIKVINIDLGNKKYLGKIEIKNDTLSDFNNLNYVNNIKENDKYTFKLSTFLNTEVEYVNTVKDSLNSVFGFIDSVESIITDESDSNDVINVLDALSESMIEMANSSVSILRTYEDIVNLFLESKNG